MSQTKKSIYERAEELETKRKRLQEEHDNKFTFISWLILHTLLMIGIAIAIMIALALYQEVFAYSNNTTCNPIWEIMEQWLDDPNEYKCYNT